MQALAAVGRRIAARRDAAAERWFDSERRRAWIRSPSGGRFAAIACIRLVHVFGDSHAVVFREIARRRMLRRTLFDVMEIPGATAVGLANPNSRTRALPRFERVIRTLPPERPLLFMLGEVDCGFVIWYQAKAKGASPEAELERSLAHYTRFLEGLIAAGRREIVVAAAPPPTILDGQDWGEVANLRREVTASLADRTNLTLEYNARLREWANGADCVFLDYDADVIDPVTGVIATRFRSPSPLDHHLAAAPFAAVVARHLQVAGFR